MDYLWWIYIGYVSYKRLRVEVTNFVCEKPRLLNKNFNQVLAFEFSRITLGLLR